MNGLYQSYVDNLSAACALGKPPVAPDMPIEQVIKTIRDSAEKLHLLHQENDRILKEILFSKNAESLTAEEAQQLYELSGALFQFNRSPDTGVAYHIHKLLYAYAEYHQDVDMMVRELYSQGITLLYLNVRDTQLGVNMFLDKIGGYFRAGAAYMERYEELTNPQTRSYIIRCLGNLKYGIESFQGGNSGQQDFNISQSWPEYMDCFNRTMEIIQSPRYREMNPEIPWDSFAYTMHYDRTQFLSGLRNKYDPVIAEAVLESARYVYHHQEQIAKVKGRAINTRTMYVYTAARFHAGLASASELVEVLFALAEAARLDDFSGDNIWTILYVPEYLVEYIQHLPPQELEAAKVRLEQMLDKQKEFLFLLPRNEYAMQVSKTLHTIAQHASTQDRHFYHRILDYILACHPPTFVHSKVVALMTRRFCREMAKTAPALLEGTFGIENVTGSSENLEYLLEMAYQSGLYHDLGKCMLLNYVGLYGRRLLDEEFACIKLHPLFGCGLLEMLGMQDFSDAALFHHLSSDGMGGYPLSTRECPASARRIVDIITIVDALDAGTDNIGRSYAAAKSYAQLVEELRAGAGTRYAPDVVSLFDNPDFYRETEQFLSDSRYQVYMEAYCGKE